MRVVVITIANEIANELIVFKIAKITLAYTFILDYLKDRKNVNLLVKTKSALQARLRKGHVVLVATDSECKYYLHDANKPAISKEIEGIQRKVNST